MADTQTATPEENPTSTGSTTKKAAAKKATAKKSAVQKATAKKSAAKKSATRKSSAKRSPAKEVAAKKVAAKKPAAKKPAAKKPAAEKPAAKKPPARKTLPGLASTRAAAEAVVARATAVAQRPVEAGKALAERAGERVAGLGRAVSMPSSAFFARAPVRARELAADPEALRGLADKALHSASGRSGPLGEVADELRTLGRLVTAYARGDYRDIPLDSLIMVVAGLVYVVSPIDLIPEFVPVAGYADDAVAIGFVIRQVHHELDAFRHWEAEQSSISS